MSNKIGGDLGRFKQIIREKVKHNLGKYVSRQDLVGQQGKATVKIPLDYIDLPRFSFGGGQGGTGSGDGDPGDPIDGSGKKQPGQGKAGNDKGEHGYAAEFTTEDLAQMLGEELQLPNIEEKAKGKTSSNRNKYSGINRVGAEGLRHFRRTFKQALLRNIASGSYNAKDPKIIPIRDDKRYRSASPIQEPAVNTVMIYIIDVSGSMDDSAKQIAKSEVFWIDAWLKLQYKDLETRFLIHDTEASEVDRDQFFSISEGGGTSISSAYEYCSHLMETEYPYSDYNVYVMHFSDGDNWSGQDSENCISILKDKILPNCNLFCYEQISTSMGSGNFYDYIASSLKHDNLIINKIENKDGILQSIKKFLGTGK